ARPHRGVTNDKGATMNDSIPNAGLIAGVGLLLMAALSVLGVGFVLERLVTPGDAAQTAADIAASAGLFRLGVVSLFVVVALDMLVDWGLYRVLQPVSNRLSALAAACRLVHAGVFAVASGSRGVREIGTFYDVWDAGLVLLGLHLRLVGSLAYRSGYIPRLVGAVVAVSGFGYVFDSAARVLVADSLPELTVLTGAGELVLALWLVF